MGTWSHEPFGNDSAADWAFGLEGQQDFSAVEAALRQVVDNEGYLDADMAVEAIAAAEVLAKANDRGTQFDAYTKPVEEWLESIKVDPPAELYVLARRALSRICSLNPNFESFGKRVTASHSGKNPLRHCSRLPPQAWSRGRA